MDMETLVPDDLWALIAPLLPPRAPHRKGGRPWLSDRRALAGIIFILKTGCAWNTLPRVLGCGSGSTCWRRLRDWQGAGVWQALHRAILDESTKKSGGIMPLPALVCLVTAQVESQDTRFGRCLPTLH